MPFKLAQVKGVGRSAEKKLRSAGIRSADKLAKLDQRTTSVPGLSPRHVAELRENARILIEAKTTGDLAVVPGLGPTAKRKLEAAGIRSIRDLVEVDLRRVRVEGLSTERVQRLKREASFLV